MSERYYTTAEAAEYLRYRSSSGVRSAVARGALTPAGKWPRNVLLFTREELDAFVARRARCARRRMAHPERESNEASSRNQKAGSGSWSRAR